MILFADRHNEALAHSLRLLAKRLDVDIYFPIGEAWFTEGYFCVAEPYNNFPGTIKQFLQIKPEYTHEWSKPLNRIVAETPDYYEIADVWHGDTLKAITLEQFKQMDIDVIIASIPRHWEVYRKLRDTYKPKAKLVCHVGNIGWSDNRLLSEAKVTNLLASVAPFQTNIPHTIFYHQEFPVVPFAPYTGTEKTISSFVHLLPNRELYAKIQALLPEFTFKAYGATAPDGLPGTLLEMYMLMQQSMFGLHIKPGGDGFGHVIFSWAMIGRPVVVNYQDYQDKLADEFLTPLSNCIDITDANIDSVAKILRVIANNQQIYAAMCDSMRESFQTAVDFDFEANLLKEFFDDLR